MGMKTGSDRNHAAGEKGWLLLIAAGLAQFIVTADYFSVAIALPPMAESLHVRAIDLQWVITGYVLTFGSMLGVAGPLGDRYGRKRLLLLGIIIFCAVSIWVGFSKSVTMIIASRIALGFGGGLLFPLATAVVSHASDSRQLARNIALLTGVAILGAAFGPVLGGLLTELLSWRWIFFVNVPICTVAFIMILLFAGESSDPDSGGRLDYGGILLLMLSLGLISVGIDRIPHWPTWAWASMLGSGVGMMIGFLFLESRLKTPIIDVRLIMNRSFVGYSVAGLMANSVWCLIVFLTTLQLQLVLGYSVFDAGLFFLFLSGTVAIASFVAPALERRFGAVTLVVLALLAELIGVGLLFFYDTAIPLALALMICGIGCAWGWSIPQAGAIQQLPREKVGLASGTILTIMIMAGNTAVVTMAMVLDLYPKTKAGEAVGIQYGYLYSALIALLGLILAVILLGARGQSAVAVADDA